MTKRAEQKCNSHYKRVTMHWEGSTVLIHRHCSPVARYSVQKEGSEAPGRQVGEDCLALLLSSVPG